MIVMFGVYVAVIVIVLYSIVGLLLRQRGSPESKPVGSPHEEGGTTG